MATIHIFDIVTMKDITKEIIKGIEEGNASLAVGHDGTYRVIRFGKDITNNIVFGIEED